MANSYFDAILPQSTGVDILNTANDAARSDRSARIAELERELAEIRKQKAQFSEEGEMGRYKFLYDADPSSYMSYKQNLRNAEQTEKIRKATEDATKQSNAQNQWNSLGDKLEVAQWALRSAQNRFVEAERAKNADAMRTARDEIERYTKSVNSIENQREQIRNKFMKDLEIDTAEVELDKDAMKDYDSRIANTVVNEGIDTKLVKLKDSLDLGRKAKYSKEEIKAVVDYADIVIPEIRSQIENSNMSDTLKKDYFEQLNELDKTANNWRGTGTNKPKVKLTPEEEMEQARKSIFNDDGSMKNPLQLSKLGAKTLREYQKKYGWNLKAGIDRANRDGVK